MLGAAHGIDNEEFVLAEDQRDRRLVTVSLRRNANAWAVVVGITPSLAGLVQLTIGEYQTQAAFDASGSVVLPVADSALITGPEGPDMHIRIEGGSR
jgi:hypothetical protein